MERWKVKHLDANRRRRKAEARGKEKFLHLPHAWDARSQLCGTESTWRGEGNRWDWRNFGVKDYLTPKLRACVTPFLARVNLLGKRPMENGLMLGQRRRRNKMGLWARSRHCSRWSYGRRWRMKLASYLLDFASFKLGKFISCVASCNLAIFARG